MEYGVWQLPFAVGFWQFRWHTNGLRRVLAVYHRFLHMAPEVTFSIYLGLGNMPIRLIARRATQNS